MNKKQIINILVVLVLIIDGIIGIQITNIMFKQSAQIQELKQNNAEQEEEKEFYRLKCEEYEKMEE